jgi:hypothetical protein
MSDEMCALFWEGFLYYFYSTLLSDMACKRWRGELESSSLNTLGSRTMIAYLFGLFDVHLYIRYTLFHHALITSLPWNW